MEIVECAWHRLFTAGIRVFLLYALLALPFLILALFVIKTDPNWGYIVVFVFLLNALVWLLIGLFGLVKHRLLGTRLDRLKADGDSYELIIKRMVPLSFVHIGAHIFAAAEGHYTDSSGNIQPIKSAYYAFTTFDKWEDFTGQVYVDRNNPKFYAVELFKK